MTPTTVSKGIAKSCLPAEGRINFLLPLDGWRSGGGFSLLVTRVELEVILESKSKHPNGTINLTSP
jgi:hypothetical protein